VLRKTSRDGGVETKMLRKLSRGDLRQ
jgi:hypothetical protein